MKRLRTLHIYRIYFPEAYGDIQEAIRQFALPSLEEGVDTSAFTLTHDPEMPHAPTGRERCGKSLYRCPGAMARTP